MDPLYPNGSRSVNAPSAKPAPARLTWIGVASAVFVGVLCALAIYEIYAWIIADAMIEDLPQHLELPKL